MFLTEKNLRGIFLLLKFCGNCGPLVHEKSEAFNKLFEENRGFLTLGCLLNLVLIDLVPLEAGEVVFIEKFFRIACFLRIVLLVFIIFVY